MAAFYAAFAAFASAPAARASTTIGNVALDTVTGVCEADAPDHEGLFAVMTSGRHDRKAVKMRLVLSAGRGTKWWPALDRGTYDFACDITSRWQAPAHPDAVICTGDYPEGATVTLTRDGQASLNLWSQTEPVVTACSSQFVYQLLDFMAR